MSRQKNSSSRPRAVVVAADESLRQSLVFLLEMYGLEAVALAEAEELRANCRLDEQFIFIECTVSDCIGISEASELRRRGWQGIVIIMAEGQPSGDWDIPDGPTHILVKPFSSEDVLAIIES